MLSSRYISNNLTVAMLSDTTAVIVLSFCLVCETSISGAKLHDLRDFPMDTGHKRCPPWFFSTPPNHTCQCHVNVHTKHCVECTEEGALLKFGHCMTSDDMLNDSFVAICIYFQVEGHNVSGDSKAISLPDSISQLNSYMCGPMKREGRICSKCIDGYGPSFTSFGYQCSKCGNLWFGVLRLLAIEIVPLTIFYFVVLMFRIRMTSVPMTCFILYCHSVMYIVSRNTSVIIGIRRLKGLPSVMLTIATLVYGIWNLNFLQYILPPFCISEKFSEVHIHLAEYLLSLYPIFLVFITWVLIRLYDNNCHVIFILCQPFFYLSARLQSGCSIRNDIIDVFATFFLLTFTKLTIQSFMFIRCSTVFSISNTTFQVSFADKAITCYSKEHIPYALLGYITLFFLVMLTLLLLLYPFRLFKRIISVVGFRGQLEIILTTFTNKFYVGYRDGLDEGRDLRSFSGLYFVLRMVLIMMNDVGSVDVSLFYISVIFLCAALFISFFKPYKRAVHNLSDTLVLAWHVVIGLYYLCLSINVMVGVILVFVPVIAFLFAFIWKILWHVLGTGVIKKILIRVCPVQSIKRHLQIESRLQSPLLSRNNINIVSFGACENAQA